MSWMSKALETYENNSRLAGKIREGTEPLLPMAHMVFKAQLEISINQEGRFIEAVRVNKQDCSTIIPVTEESGGRSSGIAPHPLNDTLSYIAQDYSRYSGKDCSRKYQSYMENLRKWTVSEYVHPKVQAIYTYVSKGKVVEDLIACGLVGLDENGMLDGQKIQGVEYEKTLVRFRVMDAANPTEVTATWEDSSLMKVYGKFYVSTQKGRKDICYLTGKQAVITENHPKGVIASNYGAKLISANDKTNFTYKGRFKEPADACVISYEASQKLHAALSWLSRNQGVSVGNKDKRTYICWTSSGKKVEVFRKNLLFSKAVEEESEEPETLPEFREKLRKAFLGYANVLADGSEDVEIIGLDAATTGRLSVTYYSELKASDFLARMQYWEESCKWYFINKTGKDVVQTPNILQIVKSAYGTEQGKFIEADDRVLKEQVERLLGCMTEGKRLPFDLVHALYIKASSSQFYKNWWNREGVLSTACAVIAKYYKEKSEKGEVFDMQLDENLKDRSYLFGRLLAILEKVEKEALWKKGETRETNAIRLQSAFASHPFRTWKVLEELLNPYFRQLSSDRKNDYKTKIEKIFECLEIENKDIILTLNRPLTEMYLLGYYLQRAELSKNIKEKKKEENADE